MENKYWIVDTNNLSIVKDLFIGYTLSEDGTFYFNKKPKILDGTGSYTCIESLPDKIKISQDFLGTQGIYHYQNENRSIFSNGFEKIVDYILDLKLPLSLDKNFCVQYIFSNEEPININDTMIKEIKRIGNDYFIEINLEGKVNIIEIDYEVNTLKADSKETIEILDKWYNKWCNAIRNLVKINSPIYIDLSGGMDSRICFGLFLNSNIDKNNVIVKRNNPRQNSYAKNYWDWEISQEIIDKYNYKDRSNANYFSTENYKNDGVFPTFEEFDNLIFGNAKICDYNLFTLSQPVFHLNGMYGDRTHLGDKNEALIYIDHKKKKFNKDMKQEDIKILCDYIEKYSSRIINKYESKNRPVYLGDFSFDYIQRFFGSKMTSKIFNNDIIISPFADPLFHKFQILLDGTTYPYPMVALIYTRYFEGLLEFKFEDKGNFRIITEEEINFAKKQCEKYPFKKIQFDFIPDLVDKKKVVNKITFKKEKIRNVLEKRLKDGKERFINIFGKEYYDLAIRDFNKENIKMQNYFTPIVSICSILNKLNKVNKVNK